MWVLVHITMMLKDFVPVGEGQSKRYLVLPEPLRCLGRYYDVSINQPHIGFYYCERWAYAGIHLSYSIYIFEGIFNIAASTCISCHVM